jgi:hypothetical protein
MSLVFISTINSILYNDIYQDGDWANAQWLGQDIVTLIIALPLLAFSAHYSLRLKNQKWFLVLGGVFFYFVYTYTFYVFEANLTVLYLFHLPIFGLAVFGLYLSLQHLFMKIPSSYVLPAWLRVTVIVYLLLMGIMIASIWIMDIFSHLTIEGHQSDVPGGKPPMIIYSLDLGIVIPLMIAAATGLLRRTAMGLKLAGVMLTKTSTLGFALMAMSLSLYIHEISADSFLVILWSVLGLVGTIITILFMVKVKNL